MRRVHTQQQIVYRLNDGRKEFENLCVCVCYLWHPSLNLHYVSYSDGLNEMHLQYMFANPM